MADTTHTLFFIENFDTTKKFDRWLMRLETAFDVFEVPVDKKAAFLLLYIGSDAHDIICDKISPDKPKDKPYDELVTLLGQHYSPEPLEIAEIFRFLQRKQQEGETTQEYLTTLRRLATTCKFGNYLNKALRNQFVFGLRAQNIQSRLLEQKDLTIQKAIDIAISMEISARDAAQLHRSNTSGNVNSVNTKIQNKRQYPLQKTVTHKSNTNNCLKCFRRRLEKHFADKCNKKNLTCNSCKRSGQLSKIKMENVAASSNTTKAKPKSTDDYLNLVITNSSLGISNSKSSRGTLHPLLKSLQLQEMKETNYVVGKSNECDIVIMNGALPYGDQYHYISNRHFEITKTSDNPPVIRDISKGGTFVNGIQLGRGNTRVLSHTDTISILGPKIKLFMYKTVQNTDNNFLSEKLQEKYDVLKYLGAGSYGEVRLVSDKINGLSLYAVKKIKKNSSAWTEVQIFQRVKHPYIVSFVDSDVTNDAIFIVMEYMKQGDLEGLLKESRLNESHFKYIFLQVLMAVEHLHRQRIIHRDLKPSNILRTSGVNDHVFKISDFGLGKIFDDNSTANSLCGTRSYMAPEMYNGVGYDYSADVWSMGVLLCYMITSQLPTIKEDKSTGTVDVNIPLLMDASLDCENLIRKMLKTNPKERITIQKIFKHSWISKDEVVLRKVRLPLDENDS